MLDLLRLGIAGLPETENVPASSLVYPMETFEDSHAIMADTIITGDIGQAGMAMGNRACMHLLCCSFMCCLTLTAPAVKVMVSWHVCPCKGLGMLGFCLYQIMGLRRLQMSCDECASSSCSSEPTGSRWSVPSGLFLACAALTNHLCSLHERCTEPVLKLCTQAHCMGTVAGRYDFGLWDAPDIL